jgi:hypothetical protein
VAISEQAVIGYQELLERHPEACVYHTSDWRRIIHDSFGYLPSYVLTCAGSRTTGLLPLFEVNSFLSGRHLTAIPFSHHVPVLYESKEGLRTLVREAKRIAKRRRCKYIEIRGSSRALGKLGFSNSFHNWISRIDLRCSPRVLWDNVHASTKRNVKKALRQGVAVRRALDPRDYEIFYRMMLETRRSQGMPPYPGGLFREVRTMPQARLYLSHRRDHVLSGMIVLCFQKSAMYAYGASEKNTETLRMRPNDLLFWNVISEMQQEGYESLDLGTSHKGNEGLLRFKENWGARSELLGYSYWPESAKVVSIAARSSRAGRFASRVIRRLPLRLLRSGGELFFKQFG